MWEGVPGSVVVGVVIIGSRVGNVRLSEREKEFRMCCGVSMTVLRRFDDRAVSLFVFCFVNVRPRRFCSLT